MKLFLLKTIGFLSFSALTIVLAIFLNNHYSNFGLKPSKKILIVGHSHSACAFNDGLIPELQNCSEPGESYFYTSIKLKRILNQNRNIKVVFIQFSNNQIDKIMDKWIWDDKYVLNRFPKYATFMDMNSLKLLWSKNPNSLKSSIVPWIKFNLNKTLNKFDYTQDIGGYESKNSVLSDNKTKKTNNAEKLEYSSNLSLKNIEYLSSMISFCNSKKIKVYLVRSPLHKDYLGFKNEKILQNLLRSKFSDVEFLDFSRFPLKNSSYYDLEHLNTEGSKLFSTWLNQLLKSGLLKKENKQEYIDSQMLIKSDNFEIKK